MCGPTDPARDSLKVSKVPKIDAHPVSDSSAVEMLYRNRTRDFAGEQARHQRTSDRVSNLRSIAFLAAIGCLLYAWLADTKPALPLAKLSVC